MFMVIQLLLFLLVRLNLLLGQWFLVVIIPRG